MLFGGELGRNAMDLYTNITKNYKQSLLYYTIAMTNLDKDSRIPGGIPGEGDHAEIPGFLFDIRYAIAVTKVTNYCKTPIRINIFIAQRLNME
jgi:hypothetical protein